MMKQLTMITSLPGHLCVGKNRTPKSVKCLPWNAKCAPVSTFNPFWKPKGITERFTTREVIWFVVVESSTTIVQYLITSWATLIPMHSGAINATKSSQIEKHWKCILIIMYHFIHARTNVIYVQAVLHYGAIWTLMWEINTRRNPEKCFRATNVGKSKFFICFHRLFQSKIFIRIFQLISVTRQNYCWSVIFGAFINRYPDQSVRSVLASSKQNNRSKVILQSNTRQHLQSKFSATCVEFGKWLTVQFVEYLRSELFNNS